MSGRGGSHVITGFKNLGSSAMARVPWDEWQNGTCWWYWCLGSPYWFWSPDKLKFGRECSFFLAPKFLRSSKRNLLFRRCWEVLGLPWRATLFPLDGTVCLSPLLPPPDILSVLPFPFLWTCLTHSELFRPMPLDPNLYRKGERTPG